MSKRDVFYVYMRYMLCLKEMYFMSKRDVFYVYMRCMLCLKEKHAVFYMLCSKWTSHLISQNQQEMCASQNTLVYINYQTV
jgi:hypothetical protein